MNKEFIKLLEIEYQELKLGLSKAYLEGKKTPDAFCLSYSLKYHLELIHSL